MQTKRIVNSFALLFIVSVTAAQSANYNVAVNSTTAPKKGPSFDVNVQPDESTGFILRIQNPEKKRLHVLLNHNRRGEMVDTSIISEVFACRYNMCEANDGKYQILVTSGREKVSKEIELNTVITRNVVIH